MRWMQFSLREFLLLTALAAAACTCYFRLPGDGTRRQTGRELDLAIVGRGYFQFKDETSSQIFYTRAGHLRLDANGRITGDAGLLEPTLTISQDYRSISIAPGGRTRVAVPGQTGLMDVGQMELAMFTNPDGLREVLPGVFEESDAAGAPIVGTPGNSGLGLVAQGWLESTAGAAWSPFGMRDFLIAAVVVILLWLAVEQRRQRKLLERMVGP